MFRTVFLCILIVFPVATIHAQDRVSFLDRSSKTGTTLLRSGTIINEDPGKITLSGNDGRRSDIPISDIVEVIYEGEPQTEMNAARSAERERKVDAALAGYQDAFKKAPNDRKLLRRHLEFKLAEMRTVQAEGGANPQQAIEALQAFAKNHPESRQIILCYEHLGNCLLQNSQQIGIVLDALASLRSKYGTDNKEVAARCDLLRSDFILQQLITTFQKEGKDTAKGQVETVKQALAEIITIADRSIQPEIVAKQNFCQALIDPQAATVAWDMQLQSMGEDTYSRAAIHLIRADYYRLQQNYREAMWDYLWVDTVYFADRSQQAKALYHLIEVFDKLGDTAKSRDCRERLLNDNRLRDTRYQRLLLSK
ncbi:MAG TPA: hypothetical protein PKA06_02315 [Gemmatales bacterium]|nr:hypothetical protein [Gemmatales bacterium]HMP16564.1 hypothetical protein [Gemmatales bacterium]